MQIITDRSQAPIAIRTDLGAVQMQAAWPRLFIPPIMAGPA